jgi:hypothetical protein
MSVVQHNIDGCDYIELAYFTEGSNQADLTANDKLLLDNKDYLLGVSELVVPSSSMPLFHPTTTNTLFRIRKRVVGQTQAQVGDDDNNSAFIISPIRRFFTIAEFISRLSYFASTFSELQDAIGVVNVAAQGGQPATYHVQPNSQTRYLYLDITESGQVVFKASSHFINHFTIEVSPMAKKLLGFKDTYLSLVRNAATGAVTSGFFGAGNLVVAGGMIDGFDYISPYSIYTNCDTRLFMTVETHLNTPAGLSVVNSVEQRDSSIARYYFHTDAQVELSVEEGLLTNTKKLKSNIMLGRVAMKKRQTPIQQWTVLKSAINLYLFRFQLYITYRVYDNATNRFVITKISLPMTLDDYWSLCIAFISRT